MADPSHDSGNASEAFETLRAEVSLLRRAIEGLTAERQSAPNYTPTLVEMSQKLGALIGWAQKVSDRPALRLTPAVMAEEMAKAAQDAREEDKRLVQGATSRLDARIAQMDALVKRHRTAERQRQVVLWMTAIGFTFGIILWSFLPGGITARTHMPDRPAAHRAYKGQQLPGST